MSKAPDFAAWAIPSLTLPPLPDADGNPRTYVVHPPSVDDMGKLIAATVRGEVMLGIVKGEIPEGVQEVLDSIKDEHPALGGAYHQMVADGVNPITIDRAGYYSVFYWTRGKEYADSLAVLLWAREDEVAERTAGEPAPKD